jgi:hypothetical protein
MFMQSTNTYESNDLGGTNKMRYKYGIVLENDKQII